MNWNQWRTILWLRWRLSRNQRSRLGALNKVIGILLGLLLGTGVLVSCVTGFLLGFGPLARSSPTMLLLVWDGVAAAFLFFWCMGLLQEIQRSESLDLMRFMHLPVSLRNVFFFNYLVSWLTPSIMIALPGFLCFAAGLALGKNPLMILLVPVILGFFGFITSWTYLLRGWLVSLMSNARSRSTVIVAVTVVFITLSQLPNIFFLGFGSRAARAQLDHRPVVPAWFYAAHDYFPPFWLARASRALADGKISPALLAAAGFFALGGLGLTRAYRSTLKFYHGTNKAPKVPLAENKPASPPSRFLERKIPGLPDEVSAIALATLRSYLRSPEIKMALFSQLLINVVFGIMFFRPGVSASFLNMQPLLGTLVVVFSLLGAAQLLFNQFGFDRDGYRAYVLAPLSRRNLLLGKNLAVFPFVILVGTVILAIALAARLIGPMTFLAAMLTFAGGFLVFAMLGNLLSIISPFRTAQGSLKATKVPAKAVLMPFLSLFLLPVAFLPVGLELLCSGRKWLVGMPVNLVGSFLFLLLATIAYFATIAPLGRLLQRREREILQSLTREIE